MTSGEVSILTINGGSSSIKFAVFEAEKIPVPVLRGELKNIGSSGITFTFFDVATGAMKKHPVRNSDFTGAANVLIDWLQKNIDFRLIKAIGHRVVHGMNHTAPQLITPESLIQMKRIIAFDPEHLPGEISLMELFAQRYPKVPQIACFDTAFHTSIPQVAKLLPIPRRYQANGIQRYGFHGLSYAYLLEELERIAGVGVKKNKIIMAHLGSGASLAAIKDGTSIDTSMGFTPASGLPMSTRTGDIDPGIASYLLQQEKLTPEAFNKLVNHESGLLGLSETSGDMQELLKVENSDPRAAQAIEFFCYQVKKWIGSFAAALEGLNTIVFSGGIGENAPLVRARICNGLQFLGIEIDPSRNEKNEIIISAADSKVTVYVLKTDEQWMIARQVCTILKIQ